MLVAMFNAVKVESVPLNPYRYCTANEGYAAEPRAIRVLSPRCPDAHVVIVDTDAAVERMFPRVLGNM